MSESYPASICVNDERATPLFFTHDLRSLADCPPASSRDTTAAFYAPLSGQRGEGAV